MNNLEIIAADVSGYCDVETGACVTVESNQSVSCDDAAPTNTSAASRVATVSDLNLRPAGGQILTVCRVLALEVQCVLI
jgi:hypothetical protein